MWMENRRPGKQEAETLENIHDVLFMQLQVSTYEISLLIQRKKGLYFKILFAFFVAAA